MTSGTRATAFALRLGGWLLLFSWPLVVAFGPFDLGVGVPYSATIHFGVWLLCSLLDFRANKKDSGLLVLLRMATRTLADPGIRRCLAVAMIVRLSVLAAGFLATTVAPPTGVEVRDVALEQSKRKPFWWLQRRWDAQAYLDICVDGYRSREYLVAFFPAFPVAMCITAEIVAIPAGLTNNPDWWGSDGNGRRYHGGTTVSLLAFFVAVVGILKLARLDVSEQRARWAAVLVTVSPFGYFFGAAYTESLFLAGLVWAFLAARRRQWVLLAACGLLVGLTKHVGFLVSIPLAMVAFEHARTEYGGHRLTRLAVAAAAPIAGMGLFSWYLWNLVGDPFAWVAAQAHWHPAERFAHIVEAGLRYPSVYPFEAANSAMALIAVAMMPAIFRLNRAYGVLTLLALGIPLAMDVVPLGRITSVVFPVFFAAAARIGSPRTFLVIAILSYVLQVIAASFFYAWRPLY